MIPQNSEPSVKTSLKKKNNVGAYFYHDVQVCKQLICHLLQIPCDHLLFFF